MSDTKELLYLGRPSLRRAYFYAFLFVGVLLYGRILTGLDPAADKFWYSAFGVLLVCLAYAHIYRLCTSYAVYDVSIELRSGIIARRFAAVPYRRVTNVSANQTALERILGLASLYIDTAGTDIQEVVFYRLTLSEAREVGTIIKQKMEESIKVVIKTPPREEEVVSNASNA